MREEYDVIYVQDYLRLRPDVAVRGESLEAVAARRQLPAAALRASVAAARRDAEAAGRPALGEAGPWVLLGPAKAYFTTTEGGARINRRLQVLDEGGRPVPGLYAVGQNGLGGQILWGHGLHIGWAMTSGRLVGRVLAEES